MSGNFDVASDILDEIALEGLDGITFKTLLERLRHRHSFSLAIDEYSKKYIWSLIRNLAEVKFYVITQERQDIVIPRNVDENQLAALAVLESKIYPFKLVSTENEAGSCTEFNTRIDVTANVRDLELTQAEEKWGSRLVIVAVLTRRIQSLCGEVSTVMLDLFRARALDYALLEQIGRTRTRGLKSCGPGSAAKVVCKDTKIAHYRTQTLLKQGVIEKIITANGPKLILTRFVDTSGYENVESGYRLITQKAIELAKKNPKGLILRSDVYDTLPAVQACKKKLRSSDLFRRCFRLVTLPYREMYPDAEVKEYLNKNKSEKKLPLFKLVKDTLDDEDSEDEDAIDNDAERDLYMGVPFSNQVYREVLKAGPKGILARELRNKMDTSQKTIHLALLRLQKDKEIKTIPVNKGKTITFLNAVVTNDSTESLVQRLHERLTSVKVKPEVIPSEKAISTEEKTEDEDESTVLSDRKAFRIGVILRAVKQHRVMTQAQIYHLIVDEEKTKSKHVMDRKSLKRIMDQLVQDGLLKTFTDEKKLYYCDLSYDPSEKTVETYTVDYYIQRFLEESEQQFKKLIPRNKESASKSKKQTKIPLRTFTPKFLRLSVLHDVLFYLVRDYAGDKTSSHEELLSRLEENCTIDEEVRKEMPRLYLDHISCYMFTPPLSDIHENTLGWCGLMEVVIHAPLSSIYAIISDRAMAKELSSYVDHPIRQHYPISALPMKLRQHLLSLKNLYYICGDVRRLCFMGLVKLGMRGDGRKLISSSVYVNQRASIIDTTSSEAGYMHVEKDREYPVTPYFFRVLHDVKMYWIDLFNICHQTRLGFGRLGREGLDKGKEFDQKDLQQYLTPVTNDEAIARDDGSIPGDQLGAGGLPSIMFSFIFSNWMVDKKEKKRMKKKPKVRKTTAKTALKRRVTKKVKILRLDETDREALLQMNKLRVFWSATEDTILAICKVGINLLNPDGRAKIRVKSSDIRAALRRHAGPESLDKTQLSISRRMTYMSRLDRWPSLRVIMQMTRALPEAEKFLRPFANISEVKPNSAEAKEYQMKLSQTFHELVDFLVDRYVENGMIVPLQEMTLPDTMEEFQEIYDFSEKPGKLTLKQIKENSIRAVVLSSLSSAPDKTSFVAQLLLVYRQFDAALLRRAVKNLHHQHVIAAQRKLERKKKTLLFGNSSYHFSQRFSQLLNTKFHQTVFHNAYAELNRLLCCVNDDPMEMNLINCGPAVYPLVALNLVTLSMSIPEQFVVLDTKLFPPESSSKIMKRYEELMNHPNPASALIDEEVPVKRIKLEMEDEVMDLDAEDMEVDLPESSGRLSEAPVGIRSARVALMILREIAVREVEPNRAIRKPIDICVVSTSKVLMKPVLADLVKAYGVSDGMNTKNILQAITNWSNFLLREKDEDSILGTLIQENDDNQDFDRLFDVIAASGSKGKKAGELRSIVPDAGTLVKKLEKAGIILRVGIEDIRFVTQKNALQWSIKTFKLTRLEREKIQPKSFVLPLSLDSCYGHPDLLRCQSQLSDSKAIQVVMRPWVRVDGSTNRRVLDRMLGSMLGYILCNPGIQCSAVIAKFSPAFSVAWIRELIDLLEMIGCVRQFTFRRSKTTLFSKESIELIDHLDGLEENDEILIEPKVDATVKLGQFIGNKSYAKDMLT